MRDSLKEQVQCMSKEFPGFVPELAIVQVGDREDSNVYIRMKIKAAEEIGIKAHHIRYPNTINQLQV